jgi:tetratricopeptide (TPR) repeat protein
MFASGRVDEAIALEEQALAIRQVAAPQHPLTAWSQAVIGSYLVATERPLEAVAQLERALPLVVAAYGKSHQRTAMARQSLGDALTRAGRPAEALREHLAVLSVLEASGAASIDLAVALGGIGRAHLELKSPKAAVAPLERAVALLTTSAEFPSETAKLKFALAEALWDGGGDRSRAHALAVAAQVALARASPLLQPVRRACDEWLALHHLPERG